jgi:hypothetical protein
MPDYRIFGKLAEFLPDLPSNDDWTVRWKERYEGIRAVLGETVNPGIVHSFSWKDYILPGASALTYRLADGTFLYMTMGLTQPLRRTDRSYPWEFAVRAKEQSEWPIDLLYQLLSQWLWEKGEMWFGSHMPLKFFTGHDGNIWPSLSARVQLPNVVGAIRGLHLWTDSAALRFKACTGDFGLLTAVAVTGDEDALARESTPAHVMLLLRRMGFSQICDPYRQSVLNQPAASKEWERIRSMSHDAAFEALQS